MALVWKELFARKGLINSMLGQLGVEPISWFGNQKMALGAADYVSLAVWLGHDYLAAGLKEVPVTYYEAADIDEPASGRAFEDHASLPVAHCFI